MHNWLVSLIPDILHPYRHISWLWKQAESLSSTFYVTSLYLSKNASMACPDGLWLSISRVCSSFLQTRTTYMLPFCFLSLTANAFPKFILRKHLLWFQSCFLMGRETKQKWTSCIIRNVLYLSPILLWTGFVD